MRGITKQMIDDYKLKKLGYDFMGYHFNNINELSFHHLIIPRRLCQDMPDRGYNRENGAILKRKDWENMVKEVFEIKNIEKIDFYEDTTIIEKLIKEKLLSDNYKLLSKEIPSKHLHTINRFVNYVSEELRKGNTFSPKVIEIFNHYKKNS